MDNYLSGRWPEARPEPLPAQEKRRGGRRLWKNLLVCLLGLLVIAGIAVGCYFGIGFLMDKLESGEVEIPGVVIITPPPSDRDGEKESEPGEEWTAAELPSARPDPSLQLRLVSGEGEVMDGSRIYEQVLPSIVSVQATQRVGYSTGSGIVISEDGYILTNYHIVKGGTELAIMRLSDRMVFDAGLVGYDEELDLAVLKANGHGFTPAVIGNSDDLQVGDPVYAIGNPMGYLYGTMTDGIVSGLSPDRISELDYPGRLIQTSAVLNSGNSGGALVDSCGRVVGITSAKVTGVRENIVIEGLGLAIPIADARPYLDRILRSGESARPSIGITCYSTVMGPWTGVCVESVTEGTPAQGVLRKGDLILAANGVYSSSIDDLTRVLAGIDPGGTVELTIVRFGQEQTVTVGIYDRLKAE